VILLFFIYQENQKHVIYSLLVRGRVVLGYGYEFCFTWQENKNGFGLGTRRSAWFWTWRF
jgi:hypothetical protein